MTRALIVIDVQESFRQRAIWSHVSAPDLVSTINRRAEHARAEGDMVIRTEYALAGRFATVTTVDQWLGTSSRTR